MLNARDLQSLYSFTSTSPELQTQQLESRLTSIAAELSTLLERGHGNVTCRSYMRCALTNAQDAVRTAGMGER